MAETLCCQEFDAHQCGVGQLVLLGSQRFTQIEYFCGQSPVRVKRSLSDNSVGRERGERVLKSLNEMKIWQAV